MKIKRILGSLLLIAVILFVALGNIHTSVQACHAGDVTVVPGTCSTGSLGITTITGLFNGGSGYRGTVTIDGVQVYQQVYSGSDVDHNYDESRALSAGSHTIVATLEQGSGSSWTLVGSPVTKTFTVIACPTATPVTPTVTSTFTATPTNTATFTPTATVPTATPTNTATATNTPTGTLKPSLTPTNTLTATPVTPTATPVTPTATSTVATNTPTATQPVVITTTATPEPHTPIKTGAGDSESPLRYLAFGVLGLALIALAIVLGK